MRKQAICWLILAALLLTGCNRPSLRIYTVLEENNTGYLVRQDDCAYSYQDGVLTPLGMQYAAYRAIQPFESFACEYSLSYIDLASYTGHLDDAVGYTKYLISLDYELVSKLYNSMTYDVLLRSEDEEIRVLYLGGDTVRIFYKNFLDGSILPPYTNGKEG